MSAPSHSRAHDRLFFGGMAVALALVVFIGFGPTYYWASFGAGRTHTTLGAAYTGLFRLHGAVFTAWVACFLAQVFLVAGGRVALHRRLGYAVAVLAVAMVMFGMLVSVETARQGIAPAGSDPVSFMIVPMVDMLMFGGFVAAAVIWRWDAPLHKRLMLAAYACLLVAALIRIPAVVALGPAAPVLGSFVPLIVGMAYDRRVHGRVHRAYKWSLAILVGAGLRVPIGQSAAWHALAAGLME